jgi:hypothetical protein
MDSGRSLRIVGPAAGLPPGADIINGLGGERKIPREEFVPAPYSGATRDPQ